MKRRGGLGIRQGTPDNMTLLIHACYRLKAIRYAPRNASLYFVGLAARRKDWTAAAAAEYGIWRTDVTTHHISNTTATTTPTAQPKPACGLAGICQQGGLKSTLLLLFAPAGSSAVCHCASRTVAGRAFEGFHTSDQRVWKRPRQELFPSDPVIEFLFRRERQDVQSLRDASRRFSYTSSRVCQHCLAKTLLLNFS